VGINGNDLALPDRDLAGESRGAAAVDDTAILDYQIEHDGPPFFMKRLLAIS
jgi:hypothetical protein